MKSKLLSLSIALATIVSTVGCRPEVYPYCYGVNEKNMPPKVVLVENSLEALRYTWNVNDRRLRDDNTLFGYGTLLGIDGAALNHVSCNNIDGFEDVSFFEILEVDREMSSAGEIRETFCEGLSFAASSDTGDISLERVGRHDRRRNVFYSMYSKSMNTPEIFAGEGIWSKSVVSISPTYVGRNRRWEKKPLREEELYAQETEDNSPPLIIARVWYFDNIPETAEVKTYLGIESDDEMLHCVDLYFGYFSR